MQNNIEESIGFEVSLSDNTSIAIFDKANNKEKARIMEIFLTLSTAERNIKNILEKIKDESAPKDIYIFHNTLKTSMSAIVENFNFFKENQIKILYGTNSPVFKTHGIFPTSGIIHYPYGKLAVENIEKMFTQVRILTDLLNDSIAIINSFISRSLTKDVVNEKVLDISNITDSVETTYQEDDDS